jgi:hypothetical protein
MNRRCSVALVLSWSVVACSPSEDVAPRAEDAGLVEDRAEDVAYREERSDVGPAPADAFVARETKADESSPNDSPNESSDAGVEDGPRSYVVRDADWSGWDGASNGDGGLDMTGWTLVWSDEFGGPLDESAWTASDLPVTWNHELEAYSPGNVSFENGALVLEARAEQYLGREYTSGKIDTEGKKAWTYGRFVAKIKLPAVQAMWPAFWLLSTTGSWPAGGEIDVMEARGRAPGEARSAAHWADPGDGATTHRQQQSLYAFAPPQAIDGWHEYAVEWTNQRIIWSVDGKPYWSMAAQAPFDHDFFVLLNLAVGGDFDPGVLPPPDMAPARMYVDYVRVYQKR